MSFLLNVLSTLFMTGLIWFVQVVHYPLFNGVGLADFADYEKRHSDLTTYIVIVPMFAELISAALLVWQRPHFCFGARSLVGFRSGRHNLVVNSSFAGAATHYFRSRF